MANGEILQVQELFHGLIRSRAREGAIEVPAELPVLSRTMLTEAEPRWFAVPGMYGGFAYRMHDRDGRLELVADSWCRVVQGSEQRHVITAQQVILQIQAP